MMKRTIASRYAKALFILDVNAKKQFEERIKEMNFVLNALQSHPKLIKILQSPQLLQTEKEKLIENIFNGIKDRFFLNFIFYLIKKNRLTSFKDVVDEYQKMIDKSEKKWEAKLMSSTPIDQATKQKLVNKLEQFYQRRILIKDIVDPKMNGGILLVIGNHVIDWTLKTRLKKFKDNLLAQTI